MKCLSIVGLLGLLAHTAIADVVHLANGGVVRGTVLQENAENVVVAKQYGTVKVRRSEITSIEKAMVDEPEVDPIQPPEPASKARLPRWSRIVEQLATAPWAEDLTQIPATVIDKGVLRSVPYTSYRCGDAGEHEVNVYGDPDAPSGIEIGVYGALTKDEGIKRRCISFLASTLSDPTDSALAKALRLDQDKVERSGLTIEVTPPTAEDAYGGWWVTAYFLDRVEASRARDEELKVITVARAEAEPDPPSRAAPSTPKPSAPAPVEDVDTGWSREELQKARPAPASSGSSPSTGKVYVRGYYRKDGTYVRGHSRSRPRKR